MASVLVVDEDPWTQRMVSAVLTQGGHRVDLASDGWEALIRVGRRRPDLVISELELPTTDGWSLAESIRSRADTAKVPFIFLASFTADREPGRSFRRQTDQILPKPFRLEQIETAVVVALQAAGVAAPTPTSEPVFEQDQGGVFPGRPAITGLLEEIGLSSLLVLFELERKSGVVTVEGPGAVGRIFLRGGRIVRAHIEDTDEGRGAMAVYEMLTWPTGHFEFKAGSVSGEDEIGSSTTFLLLEGARLQDERDRDNN